MIKIEKPRKPKTPREIGNHQSVAKPRQKSRYFRKRHFIQKLNFWGIVGHIELHPVLFFAGPNC